jgi:hypothetical protein
MDASLSADILQFRQFITLSETTDQSVNKKRYELRIGAALSDDLVTA